MNSIVYLIILASPLFSDGICHVYYDNGNFMLRKFLFVNDNIIVSDVCRIFIISRKLKKEIIQCCQNLLSDKMSGLQFG